MIVVMVLGFASGTHRIFGLKLIVGNAMENARIYKLLQAAVNGGPVNLAFKLMLQIAVRQGITLGEKLLQNLNALRGMPQLKVGKQVFGSV